MRRIHLGALALTFALFAPAAPAQFMSMPGFWMDSQTGSVGSVCQPFSCTPVPGAVLRGETVTFTVYGPMWGTYAIGLSVPTSSCVWMPWFFNGFALDPGTVQVFAVGQMSFNNVGPCYGGSATVPVAVPQTLPVGAQVQFQALTLMNMPMYYQMAMFSTPIRVTVR